MLHQRPNNCWYTTKEIYFVLLNKLHRFNWIPLVLRNDCVAVVRAGEHSAQSSDVEVREGTKPNYLWLWRIC